MGSSKLQVKFEYGPATFGHSTSTCVFRKKEVTRDCKLF